MPLSIRRVTPHDADALRRVRLAALADAPSAFGSTYEAESALEPAHWSERARASSSGSLTAAFLALDGGAPVGVVGGHRTREDERRVELVSMWTAPTHRRTGLGRALVGAVLGWADASGAEVVALWVTRGNEAAEALYRRIGFRPTDRVQPLPSDPCREEIRMELRRVAHPSDGRRPTWGGASAPQL